MIKNSKNYSLLSLFFFKNLSLLYQPLHVIIIVKQCYTFHSTCLLNNQIFYSMNRLPHYCTLPMPNYFYFLICVYILFLLLQLFCFKTFCVINLATFLLITSFVLGEITELKLELSMSFCSDGIFPNCRCINCLGVGCFLWI